MTMTMLGMPTQPNVIEENRPAAIIPAAAMAMSNAPQAADVACLGLAADSAGVRRCRISSTAKIERLKQQLPRSVPKARSGEPTSATELTEVTSSGMVVIAATSTSPIHILPNFVFSAMASPYRASLVPANKTMPKQRTNWNQIKAGSQCHG